jgi:hypothetical protein
MGRRGGGQRSAVRVDVIELSALRGGAAWQTWWRCDILRRRTTGVYSVYVVVGEWRVGDELR